MPTLVCFRPRHAISTAALASFLAAAACSSSDGKLGTDGGTFDAPPGGSGGKMNPGSGGGPGSGGATHGSGGATAGSGGTSGGGGSTTGSGGTGSGGTTGSGGLAGSGGSGARSAGCGKTFTRPDVKKQQTIQVNGTTRYYLTYLPTSYDPGTPLPLVVVMHGMDMNNWWAANATDGFKLIEASQNKAILVYPQGTGDVPKEQRQWGDIKSTWSPGTTGADEKFIDALLTSVENTYCVDTAHRFVTGFSMGGWMTESLACDHTNVFRAYAPVAGWGPGGMETGHGTRPYCSNTGAAVAILITQGSTDTIAAPGVCGEYSRDFWVGRDSCSSTTTPVLSGCVSYSGCKSGTAVSYCTHTGGHYVPSNTGANIWSFFSSFL